MTKRLKITTAGLLISLLAALPLKAQQLFDTNEPDQLLGFGLRLGLNTSNQTAPSTDKIVNLDGWGTGFDVGAVVDINFRNFISLQPGIFFETRSHNYSYVTGGQQERVNEYGHTRNSLLKIPIMLSLKMNLSWDFKWIVEVGPYFGFGIDGSDNGTYEIVTGYTTSTLSAAPAKASASQLTDYKYHDGYYDNRNKFDCGLRVGTGIKYKDQYSINVHYDAGGNDVFKNQNGGKHKAWTFTLGYDF